MPHANHVNQQQSQGRELLTTAGITYKHQSESLGPTSDTAWIWRLVHDKEQQSQDREPMTTAGHTYYLHMPVVYALLSLDNEWHDNDATVLLISHCTFTVRHDPGEGTSAYFLSRHSLSTCVAEVDISSEARQLPWTRRVVNMQTLP